MLNDMLPLGVFVVYAMPFPCCSSFCDDTWYGGENIGWVRVWFEELTVLNLFMNLNVIIIIIILSIILYHCVNEYDHTRLTIYHYMYIIYKMFIRRDVLNVIDKDCDSLFYKPFC